jgi:hypothetical protein
VTQQLCEVGDPLSAFRLFEANLPKFSSLGACCPQFSSALLTFSPTVLRARHIRAVRDIQLNYIYSFVVTRVLNLDSRALTVGAIARERTNIQAAITAQVNATAFDGTTILRKSGTARTTLRDKATAKSDHSGQFLTADVSHLPSLVVARLSDNARSCFNRAPLNN